jgi:Class II flagellar assembly regulator
MRSTNSSRGRWPELWTPPRLRDSRPRPPELADSSGDSGVDGVLAEIGLRVEVELAKLGAPAHALAPAENGTK